MIPATPLASPPPPQTAPAAASPSAAARADALRGCTILLVDDEEANLDLLEGLLESEGFTALVRANDARTVPALMERHAPDLVLLDLHMPHRHGLDVLQDLRAATPPGDYRPVLVLTADATWQAKERALAMGARDFLTKPFDAVEVLLRVENLLETRALHVAQRAARERAEAAEARAALLAEWSRLLAATLDLSTSLAHLPRLLVPRWADACTVLTRAAERAASGSAASGSAASGSAASGSAASERPATDGEAPALAPALAPADASRVVARAFVDARAGAWDARMHACAAATLGGMHGVHAVRATDDAPAVLSAPIADADGVVGAIVVARAEDGDGVRADPELVAELAARASQAAEHARLLAAAELATQERERLLAVVAHDLRNPLGVVAMYAEMLGSLQPDEGGDPYVRGALATMHDSTAAMQRLVEDLLDVSTLRQGALRVYRAEHRLGDVFAEAERMLRPVAESRGVALAVHGVGGAAERQGTLDAPRVVQLLSNLVGNALKFTPAGGEVEVRYALGGESPEEDALVASVRDTGPGIAPDDLPHIFTAFWQRDQRERRGVGLGLWIARAIVDAHGGRLRVESQPGQGTTFHLTLPFAAPMRRWED